MAALDTSVRENPNPSWTGLAVFPLAAFLGAFLIFLVEPMAGKMILPLLGGAPAVWNTALAFFQLALLAGYLYAHLLQKWIARPRLQWGVHLCVLSLALLSLPLHLTHVFGDADPNHPILWILGVMTLSLGAPFIALSATAPLIQAWFARSTEALDPTRPAPVYALYAASNLGSLAALLAYPTLVEPLSDLSVQRLGWSAAFLLFVGLMGLVGVKIWRSGKATSVPAGPDVAETVRAPTARDLLMWIALAAAPSSLLMGVTSHLTTDVASAPFLWVAPLAIYLLTFVIAFASRQWVKTEILLMFQAAVLLGCLCILPTHGSIGLQIALHLGCFFLTAWVCHQKLAESRPDPRHLTLFYLCLSVGGVVGGSFNAFLAPIIFNRVYEYPLVLVLAVFARPWSGWRLSRRETLLFAAAVPLIVLVPALQQFGIRFSLSIAILMLLLPLVMGFLIRDRTVYFAILVSVLLVALLSTPTVLGQTGKVLTGSRSFFGVTKVTELMTPELGPVHLMMNGTTIHGAQASTPTLKCLPLTYYGLQTGIGRTVSLQQAAHPQLNIGVVGLGAGTLATYLRPNDHLTYFEIDPLVVRYASDPNYFTFLSQCGRGQARIKVGDGRLLLKAESGPKFDLLVVDAFSSDSVPAHLLTVEAMKLYFQRLSPHGVLLMHITNRHLALAAPVVAGVRAAGGFALHEVYRPTGKVVFQNLPSEVVVAARASSDLAEFVKEPGFATFEPGHTRAWTDDYTNLVGAMLAKHR